MQPATAAPLPVAAALSPPPSSGPLESAGALQLADGRAAAEHLRPVVPLESAGALQLADGRVSSAGGLTQRVPLLLPLSTTPLLGLSMQPPTTHHLNNPLLLVNHPLVKHPVYPYQDVPAPNSPIYSPQSATVTPPQSVSSQDCLSPPPSKSQRTSNNNPDDQMFVDPTQLHLTDNPPPPQPIQLHPFTQPIHSSKPLSRKSPPESSLAISTPALSLPSTIQQIHIAPLLPSTAASSNLPNYNTPVIPLTPTPPDDLPLHFKDLTTQVQSLSIFCQQQQDNHNQITNQLSSITTSLNHIATSCATTYTAAIQATELATTAVEQNSQLFSHFNNFKDHTTSELISTQTRLDSIEASLQTLLQPPNHSSPPQATSPNLPTQPPRDPVTNANIMHAASGEEFPEAKIGGFPKFTLCTEMEVYAKALIHNFTYKITILPPKTARSDSLLLRFETPIQRRDFISHYKNDAQPPTFTSHADSNKTTRPFVANQPDQDTRTRAKEIRMIAYALHNAVPNCSDTRQHIYSDWSTLSIIFNQQPLIYFIHPDGERSQQKYPPLPKQLVFRTKLITQYFQSQNLTINITDVLNKTIDAHPYVNIIDLDNITE